MTPRRIPTTDATDTADTRDPIAVVGGSLAGMAAAARLAKLGHRVVLLERTDQLGGRARTCLPDVWLLPAPWRDLFKKSGRAFDAELTRAGLALVEAPAAVHRFSDGSELLLPSERGAQEAAITDAFGRPSAHRWRDLVDGLVDAWQRLRPRGLETDDHRPDLLKGLDARHTVDDLARDIDEPHLAEIIRNTARRAASDPALTPSWVACRLAVERTFGRWQLVDANGFAQPGEVMVELLAERLRLRKVDIRLASEVTAIAPTRISLADGQEIPVAAVICATDAATQERLVRTTSLPDRLLRRRRFAAAPRIISETLTDNLPFSEIVEHTSSGPRVSYHRPLPDGGTLRTVHDHRTDHASRDPGFGYAHRGAKAWAKLPSSRTRQPGIVLAGAQLRGGNLPDQIVLSGAIASYECDEFLGANRRHG